MYSARTHIYDHNQCEGILIYSILLLYMLVIINFNNIYREKKKENGRNKIK